MKHITILLLMAGLVLSLPIEGASIASVTGPTALCLCPVTMGLGVWSNYNPKMMPYCQAAAVVDLSLMATTYGSGFIAQAIQDDRWHPVLHVGGSALAFGGLCALSRVCGVSRGVSWWVGVGGAVGVAAAKEFVFDSRPSISDGILDAVGIALPALIVRLAWSKHSR